MSGEQKDTDPSNGDDETTTPVYELWYFWVGIAAGVLVLGALGVWAHRRNNLSGGASTAVSAAAPVAAPAAAPAAASSAAPALDNLNIRQLAPTTEELMTSLTSM